MNAAAVSRREAGVLFGLVSSIFFSASGTFAKALTDAGFSALEAVWLRILGACVILILLELLRGPSAVFALARNRSALGGSVLFGLIAVAACQAMYFVAASRLPVGIAILLEFTGPVLVVLYQRLILRKHVRPTAFLGIVMALVGLCCVVEIWSGLSLDALGLACGLGAAAGNAAYFLIMDRLTGSADPLAITTVGMIVACIVLVPLATPWNAPWHVLGSSVALARHSIPAWFIALALVLISTVIPYVLGGMAVQRLSAAVAAGLAYVEPVSACVIAWVLLGQRLSAVQIAGGVVVLLGAYTAQRSAAPASLSSSPSAEPVSPVGQ
ncbi:EamA family transporter [Actinospica sp.]|uniref:EamA family transporter n=1 Tax=Actinospica sp. TaxID=1872142 RepID=UPI002D0DD983|nr:EamA family transporter [Actinospica sp.]HWG27488.1 EamA family transporter [Actinospica sp.]